jgi:hypothetical protein
MSKDTIQGTRIHVRTTVEHTYRYLHRTYRIVVVETPTGGLKTRVNVVGVSGDPYLTFDHGDIVAVCQHIDAHPYGEPPRERKVVTKERYDRAVASDMLLTNAANDALYQAYGRHTIAGHYREVKIRAGLKAMADGRQQIGKAHMVAAIAEYRGKEGSS